MNKAIALLGVEPPNGALSHENSPLSGQGSSFPVRRRPRSGTMLYLSQMPSAPRVRIPLQANVFLRAQSRPRVVGASERLRLGAGQSNRGRASCASKPALVRGNSKSARSLCSRMASRDPRLDAPDCARTPRLLHSLSPHVFTAFFTTTGGAHLRQRRGVGLRLRRLSGLLLRCRRRCRSHALDGRAGVGGVADAALAAVVKHCNHQDGDDCCS